MKYLKVLNLAVLLTMALMALVGAGSASATTLEVTGTTKNESVALTMSYKVGTAGVTRDTFGFFANKCTGSHVAGKTESGFSTKPTGKISELTFSNCDHTLTAHNPGKLYVEWIAGTNGRVYSEETELTMYSTIHGTHIECRTGAGTPIGTLTGVASGQATLDVNATLTCAPHIHSAKWTGEYSITSPTGLGVEK